MSGKSLSRSDATKKRLFFRSLLEPLDMKNSTFAQPSPEVLRSQSALGAAGNSSERWRVHPEMAAAGLWTTASDLALFAIELQLSRIGKSNRVLSPSMTRLMLTRRCAVPPVGSTLSLKNSFGLGIFLGGKGSSKRFSHTGGNFGFVSHMFGTFDGRGAVVLAKTEELAFVGEILGAIAREFNWIDYNPPTFDT